LRFRVTGELQKLEWRLNKREQWLSEELEPPFRRE
jgi:hypothetical protein